MKIKQEYEIIKTKILTTTERLKTKLRKTRKQAALYIIKYRNLKLEQLEIQLEEQKKNELELNSIK